MRPRLSSLIERLRRRRATRQRQASWPVLIEPVVPALRGWPVEPPAR